MKRTITGLAIFAAATASAAAQQSADLRTTCARGDDARIIEVVAPGSVGQSCDVRYTRGGGANVSVPYHADNSGEFCARKAREMAERLAEAGYSCSAAPPALRADAAPASDYVVEARRAEPQTAEAPPPAAIEQPAAAATEPEARMEIAPASATPPQLASAPAEGDAEEPVEDAALETSMSEILGQPPLSGAPAQLVAQHADVSGASAPAAGDRRLTGAAPEAPSPKPAAPVTQASAQAAATPSVQTAAAVAPQPQPAQAAASAAPEVAPARTPQDIIRATLMAQAAAWNEGDLDAFMATYWKSDDLKFVSSGSITRGWDATLKRYRERYAGGSGLGVLGFENLDVKMITADVATVTGRFKLVKDGAPSTGVFSLVMRRDSGAWRIVHDHTSGEAAVQ